MADQDTNYSGSIRAQGRRKSNFPGSAAVPDSANFDYFSSGVNYKVTFDVLKTAMGALGTLEAVGSITGTPVLTGAGTDYQIRTLENGSGVKASTSPENGITLDHNFTVDAVGQPLMLNKTAASPTIVSLVAGDGIALSAEDEQIRISSSSTPVTTKTVLISQESDFPAAVGGIIPLEDETDYLVVNDVTTANRFDMGSACIIRASGAGIIFLTYTGTGAMFTALDNSFSVEKISVSCPNGSLFDVSATVPGAVAQLLEAQVASCDTLGNIDGQFITRIDSVSFLNIATDGFTFTGINQTFITDQTVIFINGGNLYDFGTALFVNILISNQVIESSLPGTGFIAGAVDSGNIIAGGLASVVSTRISGDATPLTGITSDDVLWQFLGNDDIPDTKPDSLNFTTSNTDETVITATSSDGTNAVKMEGTWSMESERHFLSDSTGRITYIGIKEVALPIDMAVTMEMDGGGDRQVTAYIAVNGVPVSASGMQATASGSKVGAVTVVWQHVFVNGDYVELFLEGNQDTTNIIGQRAVIRIN